MVQLYESAYRYVAGFLWKRWPSAVSQWDPDSFRDFDYRVVDKALSDLAHVRSITAWLRKVAHNAMIDHIRRGSTKIDESSVSLDAPVNPDDEAEATFHEAIGEMRFAMDSKDRGDRRMRLPMSGGFFEPPYETRYHPSSKRSSKCGWPVTTRRKPGRRSASQQMQSTSLPIVP